MGASIDQIKTMYGIDARTLSTITSFSPVIMANLDAALNRFYSAVQSWPGVKEVFGQVGGTERAKSAQKAHWQKLFTGRIDEEYVASTARIGHAHAKLGIDTNTYMSGYGMVVRDMMHIAGQNHRFMSTKGIEIAVALHALTTMDLALTLQAYDSDMSEQNETEGAGQFADRLMDRTVDLSICVNEAAISNASMMASLKHVDQEAQSIAAAVEEMIAGVHSIAESSTGARDESEAAMQYTQQGRTVVSEAVSKMGSISEAVSAAAERVDSLAEASAQIGEIVGTIEDIADQTNLLALNATIEAARAGEAGKGFAVVAGEVKNLSQQTARATDEIRGRIDTLRDEMAAIVDTMRSGTDAVAEGREAITSVDQEMSGITQTIEQTAHRMEDIANILAEQTAASNEVGGAVSHITEVTTRNVADIESNIGALREVERLIGQQLGNIVEYNIPRKIIRIAKSDHVIWKKRLADMLVGMESLRSDELASHESCRLGKWYYGVGRLQYGTQSAFRQLENPHRDVHAHGRQAVDLYNRGDHDGALAEIEQVETASKDVLRLLDDLAALPDASQTQPEAVGF